ncbi:MAG: 1-acyl-sn-glycerol-3-phosphate acyltransferase [Chlorobi bacterium]|nr:1-acyl-sn-glycerol-3-phosphate acyltransferase [Chlorobiota bacterium]
MKKTVRLIINFWAKSVFIIIGKNLRINGAENVDKGKKYIVVANHASLFDIPAIMTAFPEISWFGRERLLKIPLFGKILKMIDYVPMKEVTIRNTKEMLENLAEKAEGKTIGIFPEGTRTVTGQINSFHRGFIYLLRSSKHDILPVTLNGFYSLKPKVLSYINFNAKIDITVHKALSNKELIQKTDKEIIELVKSVIETDYRL